MSEVQRTKRKRQRPFPPLSVAEVGRRLQAARRRQAQNGIRRDGGAAQAQAFSLAMRCGAELIAGVAVGLGAGYALDLFLDTRPLFMVVFLIFGMAAGIRNVWRLTTALPLPGAYETDATSARNQKTKETPSHPSRRAPPPV